MALTRRSDIVLAVSVLAILTVLIFPLPALLLDLLLAVSIILSVLILMTGCSSRTRSSSRSSPTVLSSPRCCGWRSTSPRRG